MAANTIVQRMQATLQRWIGFNAGLPQGQSVALTGSSSMIGAGAIPLRGEAPTDYQRTGTTVRIRGFERHPVVMACVRAIVEIASAVPLQLYSKKTEKGKGDTSDREVIKVSGTTAPGQILVDAPSPFLSAQRLRSLTFVHYLVYGNAFWFLERPDGGGVDKTGANNNNGNGSNGNGIERPKTPKPPINLRIIQPEDVMTVYVDARGYPLWYLWRDMLGYMHTSPATDIMHFRDLNAKGLVFGFPRAASALSDIIGDDEASQFVRETVTNYGAPNAYALVNEETTLEEAQQAEAAFHEKIVKRGNRGRFVFMGGVKDIKAVGFNLRDLEFPDLRRVSREDICAAFGVDPRMIGITSASRDAGLSGTQYREARVRLIQQTIEPLMRGFVSELDLWLAPEFGDSYYRFDPDILASLVEDDDATSTRVRAEVGAGLRSVEEGREALELPAEFKDGDLLFIPSALQMTPAAVATATGDQTPDEFAASQAPPLLPGAAPGASAEGAAPPPPNGGGGSSVPVPDASTRPPASKTTEGGPDKKVPPNQRAEEPVRPMSLVLARGSIATTEDRRTLWRQFDTRAMSEEAKFRRAALVQFADEQRTVAGIMAREDSATIAKRRIDRLYQPKGSVYRQWIGRMQPVISGTFVKGAHTVLHGIAGHRAQRENGTLTRDDPTTSFKYGFDVHDPNVQQAIRDRAAKLAENVGDTTGAAISDALSIGMKEGMSMPEMADLINQMAFGGASAERATMIARTESIGALNQGQFQAAAVSGVIEGKEWLTQGDERVRDSHDECEAEGQIDIADVFENGLMYPGDPLGGPEDIINCRCSLLLYDTLEEGVSSLRFNPLALHYERMITGVTGDPSGGEYLLPLDQGGKKKKRPLTIPFILTDYPTRFNPNHDASSGEFSSGPGGVATEEEGSADAATPEAWVKQNPRGNGAVFGLARDYLKTTSLPALKVLSQQSMSPTEGRSIADSYDTAVDDPSNAETQTAYKAFNKELAAQRAIIEGAGYTFAPWEKPGLPYATSKEMMQDVRDNHHLFYFKSTEGTTPNALMSLQENDNFRAVHDFFGHAMGGNQFGPNGETNAFLDHVQMFSPEARRAMATETIGQNAWFNFSKANEGKPVAERRFADQKAFLLSRSLYEPIIARSLGSGRSYIVVRQVDDSDDYYFACPGHRRPNPPTTRDNPFHLPAGPGGGQFTHGPSGGATTIEPTSSGSPSVPSGSSETSSSSHTPHAVSDKPDAKTVARDVARYQVLKQRRATVNNDLLEYLDTPNHPTAVSMMEELKSITKEIRTLHADDSTLTGIGLPGGPKDVVIVGAGPGGLAAAIMGGTDGLDTTVFDAQSVPGGQSKFSSRIENYPGFPAGLSGKQLSTRFYDQAQLGGADVQLGVRVIGLTHDPETGLKTVSLSNGETMQARTVILAGGVEFRKLEFPGSDAKGVVVGDGEKLKDIVKGGNAVVLGGSNGAAQAALGVARHANHVYLMARSSITASMSDYQVEALKANSKVTVIENDEIVQAFTDEHGDVTGIKTKSGKQLPANGVGVFVGSAPQTDWLPTGIARERGKIVTNSDLETSIPGVFAIGDMRVGSIGRVGTAAGDGQLAERNVFEYFKREKKRLGMFDKLGKKSLVRAERTRMSDEEWNRLMDDAFASDKAFPFIGQTIEPDIESITGLRFNPNHDPATGQFSSDGGGVGASDSGGEKAPAQKPSAQSADVPLDSDYERPVVHHVKDINEAVTRILNGDVVELADTKSVNTVLTRLAEIAKDAEAKGEKAPTYDLCHVSVPGTNLFCASRLSTAEYPHGIPRIKMPQLGGTPAPGSEAESYPKSGANEVNGADAFAKTLQSMGINVQSESVPAASLKASQAELVGPKVAGMMAAKGYDPGKEPIFVSRDNYVIDGHHRWAAVVGRDAEDAHLGDLSMNVRRVDAPISEILRIANKWTEKVGLKAKGVRFKIRFNPNHDEKGLFSSGDGTASGSDDVAENERRPSPAHAPAVASYRDGRHVDVNKALRKDKTPSAESERLIQSLDDAINSTPPLTEDITVYRGIEKNMFGSKIGVIAKGKAFLDKGFTSVTTSIEKAAPFASETKRSAILKVVVPAGSKVLDISERDEPEALLPRGGRYEFTGNHQPTVKIDGRWLDVLEVRYRSGR